MDFTSVYRKKGYHAVKLHHGQVNFVFNRTIILPGATRQRTFSLKRGFQPTQRM